MSTLRDLKEVDTETTKLVYGFCRRIHNLFPSDIPYYSMQSVIVDICIAFYWKPYQWICDGPLFNSGLFSIDGDIVTKLRSTNGNIFLENLMSSGVHQYSFRFIGYEHLALDDGIIGIASEKDTERTGLPFILAQCSFGFGTAERTKAGPDTWGIKDSYGKQAKDGDIVQMIVDLDNMTLRYSINGEDQGIAHKDIPQNRYRVAVYLYKKGCKIELLQ